MNRNELRVNDIVFMSMIVPAARWRGESEPLENSTNGAITAQMQSITIGVKINFDKCRHA